MAVSSQTKEVNIQLEPVLQRDVETIARTERRTVSQVISSLVEEGLRLRQGGARRGDVSGRDIAVAAMAGGAFDWLADEPEIYDDSCGEPL